MILCMYQSYLFLLFMYLFICMLTCLTAVLRDILSIQAIHVLNEGMTDYRKLNSHARLFSNLTEETSQTGAFHARPVSEGIWSG